MTKTLDDYMQVILVQQVAFISQAQDIYKQSGRSKDAKNISELMSALSILTESIGSMNEVGIANIDIESIKVLIHKLELEMYYQENADVNDE